MKNTTLSRKPGNELKKNSGTYTEKARGDQRATSELDFDGMAGDGVNRASNRHAGNHHAGVTDPNATRNFGMGPRHGNDSPASDRQEKLGPSVTKDGMKRAPSTAKEDGKINGGASRKFWPNPDQINVGSK
jgi:hypothetical protein